MATKAKLRKRHVNFDKFRKERKQIEPVTIEDPFDEGRVHELPSALPAEFVLGVIRLQKEHGGLAHVPHEETLELSYALFGTARMQEWFTKQIDIDTLSYMVQSTMEIYTDEESEDTDDEGNSESRPETAKA